MAEHNPRFATKWPAHKPSDWYYFQVGIGVKSIHCTHLIEWIPK